MPAPPPYGSSSTCAARSGVVSRYEKRRRSSSVPRTVATGRCSVSQAKACGTRVKTSSCTGERPRLASRPGKAGSDRDTPGDKIDHAHTVLHHRQGDPGVELEHVVRHARHHVRHRPELVSAVLLDAQSDQLEHVVLV